MLIIQFDQSEITTFESLFQKGSYDPNYIASKKLGGTEVLLQILLTAAGIISPVIIEFFKDQKKKNKQIKIIRKGVEMTFESEEDLKDFLEKMKSEND